MQALQFLLGFSGALLALIVAARLLILTYLYPTRHRTIPRPMVSPIIPVGHYNDCAAMLGTDFWCDASDTGLTDVCQLEADMKLPSRQRVTRVCRSIPGCVLAVVGTGGFTTLKGALSFASANEPTRDDCARLFDRAIERATGGMACDRLALEEWRRHKCGEHAQPSPLLLDALPPRPASLSALLPANEAELDGFACAPDVQLLRPQPVKIDAAKGCLRPAPTESRTACSFLRRDALRLCRALPSCRVLHCERMSDYCQVLGGRFEPSRTRPSFGDVDLLVRADARSGGRAWLASKPQQSAPQPARLCVNRHYYASGSNLGAGSPYFGAAPRTLNCTGGTRDGGCTGAAPAAAVLDASAAHVQALLVAAGHRFATRSTAGESAGLAGDAPSRPLLLYSPAVAPTDGASVRLSSPELRALHSTYPAEPLAERGAYIDLYGTDDWLSDVQQVYRRFFGPGSAFVAAGGETRKGFYIEAGAVQGTVFDSNSIFFERFLGWRGLLVEANPFSFAKLVVRRPAAYRLETALCETTGTLRFNLPDHQRTADGCCGKADGRGKYQMRCTPLGGVLEAIGQRHVDFWSLDVEGAEMDVLKGFDWARHSLSVLLIEVYPRFRKRYEAFLAARGLVRLTDFRSPTGLNQVWYNASLISPLGATRAARVQLPRRKATAATRRNASLDSPLSVATAAPQLPRREATAANRRSQLRPEVTREPARESRSHGPRGGAGHERVPRPSSPWDWLVEWLKSGRR